MQQSGLRPEQVSQVRGFADQRLRNLKDALDPSNRRISIIVQYINSNTDDAESPGGDTQKSEEGEPSAGAKAESDGSPSSDFCVSPPGEIHKNRKRGNRQQVRRRNLK